MGRFKKRVAEPGTSQGGDPASEAAPGEPVGKLWTWAPAAGEVPDAPPARVNAEPTSTFAQMDARRTLLGSDRDVELVETPSPENASSSPSGKLWTWTPEPTESTPLAARVAEIIPDTPAVVQRDETPGVPWGERTHALPSVALAEPVATVETAEPAEPVTFAEPADEVTTRRPWLPLDPDLVLPAPPPLAPPIYFDALDEELWPGRPPVLQRRGVRIAMGTTLVAVCAVLPWVIPKVPDMFADAVPAQATQRVTDPPVDPPSTTAPLPPKVRDTLLGKRLASAGKPLEVTVPRLKVHSDVVPISGNSGELIPPSNPQLLGWWQEGTGVGAARGSAVVTGHTVSTGGGAFDHLGELVPGDHLRVRTSAGSIEYVVTASKNLPVDVLARRAKSIFDQGIAGRLVLITCSDFNGTVYLANSVVYATPVKDVPRAT